MLMPAAVLVVLILAAIAVDGAAQFVQQRELVSAAQAAANDAAASAVDQATFYRGGGVRYDPSRLQAVVDRSLRARGITARAAVGIVDGQVVVELEDEASLVFAGAVPGVDPTRTITATARSRLVLR